MSTIGADAAPGRTSSLDFASGADIIRANQKDQYYVNVLVSHVQAISRRLFKARTLHGLSEEIQMFSSLLYLAITTMVGKSTLGEEYCDITYTDRSGSQVPSMSQRAVYLSSSTLVPYILSKSWPKLKNHLSAIGPGQESVLASYIGAIGNYLTLQNLTTLHLAVFYFTGAYYSFSRRLAGLRYIFVRKMDNSADRIGYEVLGFLMLVRLGIQISTDLLPRDDESNAPTLGYKSLNIDLEDKSIMPFLDDEARKCTLCLSTMQTPTATPCGHLFCWTCIGEWTRTKPECPLCRQAAVPSHLLPLRP